MPRRTPIRFVDRSFCFTGKMSEMLRKDAEREVRARGGYTQSGVNAKLDYLVVGDVPSPSWKHGKYGTKIETARKARAAGKLKPRIVSESAFLEDLASCAPTNSGAVDTKVVVCNFAAVLPGDKTVQAGELPELFAFADATSDCFVKVKSFSLGAYIDLFGDDAPDVEAHPEGVLVRIRVIKIGDLNFDAPAFADTLEAVIGRSFGAAGEFRWFERTEGSSDYVRLIRELPKSDRVAILTGES